MFCIKTDENKSGMKQIKNKDNIDKKGKENNRNFLFKFLIDIMKPKIKKTNIIGFISWYLKPEATLATLFEWKFFPKPVKDSNKIKEFILNVNNIFWKDWGFPNNVSLLNGKIIL